MSFLTIEDVEGTDEYLAQGPAKFRLSNEDIAESKHCLITINYQYADMGETEFNFAQPFSPKDSKAYFETMKLISRSTIDEMRSRGHEFHFYPTPVKGYFRELVAKVLPEAIDDPSRYAQEFYHFGLYTKAKEDDQVTYAPRIYFMVGLYGMIFPVFYDPEHKIQPTTY